jgi:hypothetical protein
MWCDLFDSELSARSAAHRVTRRAEIFLHSGLPLARVLDALDIDEDTWRRRVAALRTWEAANLAAGRRIEREGAL